MSTKQKLALAKTLATEFGERPEVVAVGLGGSIASGRHDDTSDIDLYVFTKGSVSLEFRRDQMERHGAGQFDLNMQYWDEGDEWIQSTTDIEVDCIYWPTHWIEGQVHSILIDHEPKNAYTTCFATTIRNIEILTDKSDWLSELKKFANQPFPETLRNNILRRNLPLLSNVIPSYCNQISKAHARNDLFSVHHRLTEFLATYFDLLFAINRVFHPGEKRLIACALDLCEPIPVNFQVRIERLFPLAASNNGLLLDEISSLVKDLKNLAEN